jgi:hypothetical protein
MVFSSSAEFTRSVVIQEIPPITRHLTIWYCTVFIAVSHLSLFWATNIHFTLPHHVASRPIPILSSNLCLCIIVAYCLLVFPTKTLHTFFLLLTCYMPHPPHIPDLTWPDLTCFIHKSHHWPQLMYLFPLPCDAGIFAVKLSLGIRLQLKCKIRNMLWPDSEEIAGKRKSAGWRDSWFVVRFCYYLAD